MLGEIRFFNPYHDLTFFPFIWRFIIRLWELITGQLAFADLAADEIQIYVLAGVAASSALVGTFLVLRRMTMLANSLSHTILMGIVLAYVFANTLGFGEGPGSIAPMQAMLVASLAMGFLTTFLTQFFIKTVRLQEDASIGLVFTTLFALGVILVTVLTKDAHIGLEAVMGNVDALHISDMSWVFYILAGNILILWLFFKEFKITTFDPLLASAMGFSNTFFNYLLMGQVSATTIGAFRAVGVLLVLAFMTGPVLTARLFTHDLKKLLWFAVGTGVLASVVGVALTRHLLTVHGMALATSGVVVTTILLIYILAILFAPEQGLISHWLHRRQLQKKTTQ